MTVFLGGLMTDIQPGGIRGGLIVLHSGQGMPGPAQSVVPIALIGMGFADPALTATALALGHAGIVGQDWTGQVPRGPLKKASVR